MNQPTTPTHAPELPATIDEVLIQLDKIIRESAEGGDFLCVFTFVYRETTRKVKLAIEQGRFENGERMERMDVIFANLYIREYYNYHLSKTKSNAWDYAFKSKNEKLSLVQHILLGMNAHINLDLSVAAAAVAKGPDIIDLKNDFMVINEILAELTNTMQKQLGKVSPMMKLLDFFGFKSDEKIINFSIKKARDFAWLNAMELSLSEEKARNQRITEIDRRVLELSKMIKNPPGKLLKLLLKIIAAPESNHPEKIIEKLKAV